MFNMIKLSQSLLDLNTILRVVILNIVSKLRIF